jgi:hypothetical protein
MKDGSNESDREWKKDDSQDPNNDWH